MQKIKLNDNWQFWRWDEVSKKRTVTLPHDAMLAEKRLPNIKNGSAAGYFPGGKYTYEKVIFGDSCYENQTLILEFGGVYQKACVYLNGELVGSHIYGFTNFFVDISGKLRIGEENILRVTADNSQTPNCRWYTGSGIYRDVYLYVGEKCAILPEGLRVHTVSIDPAVLQVNVKTTLPTEQIKIAVCDADGTVVAEGAGASCKITVPNAKLWDAVHPNLYTVRVSVYDADGILLDISEEKTGIRVLSWDVEKGFQVNGNTVKLRGGCVHHDNGILGACEYQVASHRRVAIMKECGFNTIRMSHNPSSKELLQACDELGMYLINEAFDVWRHSQSDYDYSLYFDEEWRTDMEAMISSSYNHPSVIMHGIGNEIFDTGMEEGAKTSKLLADYCHTHDPSRPVLNSFNLLTIGFGSMGVGTGDNSKKPDDIVDPYEETGGITMAGSLLANTVMTLAPAIMKLIAGPKKIAKVAAGPLADVDITGFNYAPHMIEPYKNLFPDRVQLSSETHPSEMARNWKLVEKYPYLIGDCMWAGWDYLGEAGVGLPVYGKGNKEFVKPYPCICADVGSVNLLGQIESQGHYAQAIWGFSEKPYIAVRPVDHSGEPYFLGKWRLTDAIPSWTWHGCEGKKAEISVYSQGDCIVLSLNGKKLGQKKLVDCKADFSVSYAAGELVAVSLDTTGKEISRTSLQTAEKTVIPVIEAEKPYLKDADIHYVWIHLKDENGILNMQAETDVTVAVTGGELLALGSANAMTEDNYLSGCCKTHRGSALAIVRKNSDVLRLDTDCGELGVATLQL